jgi:L-ribulose-5-phosphate 3-epimerase
MKIIFGVCSWSLRPESPADLVAKVRAAGLHHVQLHLDPLRLHLWDTPELVSALHEVGISIASGMMTMEGEDYSTLESICATGGIRPDATWTANSAAAKANAAIAASLGIKLVTFHAGFIPHDASDPERATMVSRLSELATVFGASGVRIGLETGQERADTLLSILAEVNEQRDAATHVGVNFDPANVILYGMGDPAEALRKLASHVVQVHAKDANPAPEPGRWGAEVPLGQGSVQWPEFIHTLQECGVTCPVMIERESGETRLADVLLARRLLEKAMRPRHARKPDGA